MGLVLDPLVSYSPTDYCLRRDVKELYLSLGWGWPIVSFDGVNDLAHWFTSISRSLVGIYIVHTAGHTVGMHVAIAFQLRPPESVYDICIISR